MGDSRESLPPTPIVGGNPGVETGHSGCLHGQIRWTEGESFSASYARSPTAKSMIPIP